MQPVFWYLHRLKSMSVAEVLWRVNALGMAHIDRLRVSCGLLPEPVFVPEYSRDQLRCGEWRICSHKVGCWRDGETSQLGGQWLDRLSARADKIVQRRLSYFDLIDVVVGDGDGWHTDHSAGMTAPLDPINAIDYRDFSRVGDCKLVWEPNRHHQLVVLGRAYRATGELRYAHAMVEQLQSWMEANPFGRGMNWRSPLELGVRIINWVWAIDLTWESGLYTGDFQQRLLQCVYRHCWDIARKLSKGSSANNHLVGEAAGLYVASAYFDVFKESAGWNTVAQAILEREIHAQSYADGCTREHALGYQFFVLQFYLAAGLLAKRAGREFSPAYWQRLETMMAFVADIAEGGNLVMFGDKDDGYVLDLGEPADDVNALMGVGARLFGREIFARLAPRASETAFWWLGEGGAYKDTAAHKGLQSRRFSESGYYLLQHGTRERGDKASVLFDCAQLGYQSIAAHGHADALSFTLRLNDIDCLVDPGTYDYFSFPEWRNYFRSTRAHNTVEIDGQDQSLMQGPFMWARHAQARCSLWNPTDAGGQVAGEHTGYSRLSDPVSHQRTLDLDGKSATLQVVDKLISRGQHRVALYFHLSEDCVLEKVENNICYLKTEENQITLEIDKALRIHTAQGSTDPISGWISRGYHRKTPVTTLCAQGEFSGNLDLISRLSW